ncbi:trimethylamine corrinoid protein [Desulfocicer vacuolatum DSM 3385]|uniref:Trimethylamine corrinoid protein n=1 Tax=Desulfocicer vacuolatum DSM 3385 TaxID=1121400 RepID=A0A1W2CKI1_9BACT|nr:methyltransferase cognate corrinoid protein [Desulfocicer vacuolatum]SMC85700.1 trimethylamine corrinoid protein [Desulfocicer vacuolatum DSM 3385]
MIDSALIEEAKKMLVAQDKDRVEEIAKKVIGDGQDPLELMNNAFIPGINEVGDLFGRGQLFLPELMQAADAMKVATDIINDALAAKGDGAQESGASVVVATVKGDVHDIGKCIVVSLMKANGFTVHDLGRDVDIDTILEKAVEVNADVIGTSALLTTTMNQQKTLEEALKSAGLKDRFRTVVGGAPVTPRWAARIGADAYAEDAHDGVVKIREMMAQK